MAREFGPVPGSLTPEVSAPAAAPESTPKAQPQASPAPLGDNIVQHEATVNPVLLTPVTQGTWKGGRPPGYLSEGDRIILERYIGLKEPRVDIHECAICPECIDNRK